MATFPPTPEQQAIIDAFVARKSLVIEAGAGAGKTSTLRLAAEARPGTDCLYVAYNRAIKDDAAASFPRHVTCSTAHSLAYRSIGKRYADRLKGGRMPALQVARALGINEPLELLDGGRLVAKLAPQQIARLVMATVARFCHGAASNIEGWCVPELAGVDPGPLEEQLRSVVVPFARRAWADISSVDGRLPFTHDCYLKLWQLSGPRLAAEVVFLDEAQDANRLIADVVDRQTHAQRVLVGDACQQLYAWRGAVDALSQFAADDRLTLSQSFRFGPAIAEEANKWLDLLDAVLRLRGFEKLKSRIDVAAAPDAILCRTNAGALTEVMRELDAHRLVSLVGGDQQIRMLAEAAVSLKAGAGTTHPELMAFENWGQLQEYVEHDAAGSDLKVFVGLVDRLGAEVILSVCERLVPEARAHVTISTAHKSKGREWSTVRIASDFKVPGDDDTGRRKPIPRPDMMLAYVTVTRAKQVLDRGGLAWIDDYMQPAAPAKAAANGR